MLLEVVTEPHLTEEEFGYMVRLEKVMSCTVHWEFETAEAERSAVALAVTERPSREEESVGMGPLVAALEARHHMGCSDALIAGERTYAIASMGFQFLERLQVDTLGLDL